jgi:diacylglycerol kinase family enzyme
MLRRFEHLVVDFPDQAPPCQVDGERLCGTHFEIESVPAALDVIVPKGFKY